jgi:hypothetical protein
MRRKVVCGFQTGDIVRADVPKGKRMGVHIGRVAVRANGNFNVQTKSGRVPDNSLACPIIRTSDGGHMCERCQHTCPKTGVTPHIRLLRKLGRGRHPVEGSASTCRTGMTVVSRIRIR